MLVHQLSKRRSQSVIKKLKGSKVLMMLNCSVCLILCRLNNRCSVCYFTRASLSSL